MLGGAFDRPYGREQDPALPIEHLADAVLVQEVVAAKYDRRGRDSHRS